MAYRNEFDMPYVSTSSGVTQQVILNEVTGDDVAWLQFTTDCVRDTSR